MANILDILKSQTIERVDPITGRTPDLSVSDQTPDPEMGNITDQKFGWRQTLIDQSIPVEDLVGTNMILAQILDAIKKEQQLGANSQFTRVENLQVSAQSGLGIRGQQLQVFDISSFGHIYIPNDPSSPVTSYRIYKGIGTTDLLADWSHGIPLSLKIPDVDTITILFNTDVVSNCTFQLYVSVRPFLVDSPSAAGYQNLMPPYVTGFYYDSSYGMSYTNTNMSIAANQNVSGLLWFPRPLTVDQVAINVTTGSGTPGEVAVVAIYESAVVDKYALTTSAVVYGNLASAVSAPLAVDAVAQPTAPFSFTFKPNRLYLANILSNTLTSFNVRGVTAVQGWGKVSASQTADIASFRIAGTYPTMPQQLVGPATGSNSGPGIMFRAV